MAGNSALLPINEKGWRRGFANMLRNENGAWWRTRMWIVQTIIWLLILNGILATLLWAAPQPARVNAGEAGESAFAALMAEKPTAGLSVFMIMSGIAPAIAIVIIAQDAIIGEKQSGTAAWILSKPVSRTAFILSKLVANAIGILITAVILQGVIAYAQISAASGAARPIGPFLGAMGLVFLNLMFYLTLTLMLGTLFDARGPVIGIAMALLFGYQIFLGIAPWLAEIMPWALVVQTGSSAPLAVTVALGLPIASYTPIIATVLWSVIFTIVAVWRFNREEF